MSRKKLKALTFLDYIINFVLSLLAFIALSWLLQLSWGSYAYSVIFSVSLFCLLYSRGALAAKIDLREEKAHMSNAVKLALPLSVTLVILIAVYSLFYYNILPFSTDVLMSGVNDAGEQILFTVNNLASIIIRILFFNLTGFMKGEFANPLILVISPVVVMGGACTGYYFGKKKIYLLDVFIKLKDLFVKKFNE